MNNKILTLVYAYYDNPTMFKTQQEVWNSYPDEVLEQVNIIVTDDCSPKHPAIDQLIPDRKFDLQMWRVTENVPWNWIACRNKGAFEAETKWIFHTDIDMGILPENASAILKKINRGELNDWWWYTLDREKMPTHEVYKVHPNSYLMTKRLFWRIGGYDEMYSGYYGSDGSWRRRCVFLSDGFAHLHGIRQSYYPRGFIPDAGCPTQDRIRYKDKNMDKDVANRSKRNASHFTKPKSMSFKYKKVL